MSSFVILITISLTFFIFVGSLETSPLSLGMNAQAVDLAFATSKETKASTMGEKESDGNPVGAAPLPCASLPSKFLPPLLHWRLHQLLIWLRSDPEGAAAETITQVLLFFKSNINCAYKAKISSPFPSVFILKFQTENSLPCLATPVPHSGSLTVGLQVSSKDNSSNKIPASKGSCKPSREKRHEITSRTTCAVLLLRHLKSSTQ